ncbi:MAG: nodulation protein NfeD [Lautropia sp.]
MLLLMIALAAGLAGNAARWAHAAPQQGAVAGNAVLLALDGPVGPAIADHIVGGIAKAADDGAAVIVLRIDTPGGLDTSMREIVRAILASPVPVLGWVGPGGARAASAGTFILLASHVAAMAPGTNLGAATPIPLFGKAPGAPRDDASPGGGRETRGGAHGRDGSRSGAADDAADPGGSKAINDAVAYARSLARLRGRNADWAERAVRDAASLPADEALAAGVVDLVAADVAGLLAEADGRTVRAANRELRIASASRQVVESAPTWKTRVLAAIANPNVALILMMVGVYGLLLEFLNPGALVPGTVGGISLLLGLYAIAVLPLNLAGVALLVLGFALLFAEAFVPSFGVLGIGGAAAFVFGASILVDGGGVPGFEIAWPLAAGVAASGLLLGFVVARLAVGSLKHPVRAGEGAMIGETGQVIDWQADAGHVFVHGERWRAIAAVAGATPGFVHGAQVRVVGVDGLTLRVEPAPTARPDAAADATIRTVPPR